MADFFEKHGIKDEARMSIILNTFMYISKCIKSEKTLTLSSIAQQISLSGLEEYQQAALSMVRSSLEHRSNNSFRGFNQFRSILFKWRNYCRRC